MTSFITNLILQISKSNINRFFFLREIKLDVCCAKGAHYQCACCCPQFASHLGNRRECTLCFSVVNFRNSALSPFSPDECAHSTDGQLHFPRQRKSSIRRCHAIPIVSKTPIEPTEHDFGADDFFANSDLRLRRRTIVHNGWTAAPSATTKIVDPAMSRNSYRVKDPYRTHRARFWRG
jgi:hypothetical protein